jgi:PBP1b-binding outer membrane lipoprotein LpoB
MKNYLIIIFAALMLTSCATSYYYNLPTKQFNEIDYGYDVKHVTSSWKYYSCIY